MNKKRTQSSMEFLIIFTFMLSVMTILYYIVGNYYVNLSHEKEKKSLDSFANFLINEIKLAQKTTCHYYTRVPIYKFLQNYYTVKLKYNYLIIQNNLASTKERNLTYYYYLPKEEDIYYNLTKDKNGILYFIIEKKCLNKFDTNDLDLYFNQNLIYNNK